MSFNLVIAWCNHSDLFIGKIESLSMIGAVIEISQEPKKKEENFVSVELFDESGNRIANDSIKIYANNKCK